MWDSQVGVAFNSAVGNPFFNYNMNIMRVNGVIHTEVSVEPTDVVEAMINEFLNNDEHHCWVKTEDGKHWLMESHDVYYNRTETEIVHGLTQEDVDYYNALVLINKYLTKEKK